MATETVEIVKRVDRLLTTKEARWRLGISRNTLYAMIEAGQLRAVRVGPTAWALRIPESELVRYISGQEPNGQDANAASS